MSPIPVGLQEVWKLGQFDRIDLPTLSLDSTSELLSATLVGPVDPATVDTLWRLTRGNALYLRHIVEQAVADERLVYKSGYWQWSGDPVVPPGLVELVESRIGDLPVAVADAMDALAVGEPIELAMLHRIASREAVEQADLRGLIRLAPGDDRVEVWLAHPVYGQVRRRTAAQTRLRRLRGELAEELAAAEDSDDVRMLVRRGALLLDSDLDLDAGLLVSAARGATAMGDLPLADRLAKAAGRAGGGAEAMFVRGHALSWQGLGQEAEEVLAGVPLAEMSDEEHARLTYLRASNLLWALADPKRAEDVIDAGAARVAAGQAATSIQAVRGVYLFAVDRPVEALAVLEELVLEELPPIVGAETAWALATMYADAGRTADAVAAAEAGYEIAVRCADAPHMRFNIADSHVTALLLAGRVGEAVEVAERARGQAADLPGTAHLLGPAVAGRAALAAGRLVQACEWLEQAAGALSATGHAQGWGYRYGIPRATALAMRGRWQEARSVLAQLETVRRPFRRLDYEKSVAAAWVTAGAGRRQRSDRDGEVGSRICPSEWTIRRRSDVPADSRTVRGSVVRAASARTRSDCRGSACRCGGPVRKRYARRRRRSSWPRRQRLSSRWSTVWRPSMRRRTRRWRIGVTSCGVPRWDAQHGRKRWRITAAWIRRRCGRLGSRYRSQTGNARSCR